MPALQLTPGHLGRQRLNLPPVRMVNAFLEATPGGPTEDVRTSRPGLTLYATIGAGPILRQFQKPGLFNDQPFSVSGGQFYMGTTLLGSVAYSQSPRFAVAQQYVVLVCGGAVYVWNGLTLTTVSLFSDGVSPLPAFSAVAVLYNIWVYVVAGSNQFYFSNVGDPTKISAGNFGAAQVTPTPIVEVVTLAEELYFFKTDTVEIWDFTGSLTAPFAESPGRTYGQGCAAQDSVCEIDNSLMWINDDYAVVRTSTVPERISTSMIEDRLHVAGAIGLINTVKCYAFNNEGHDFYVMNLVPINETYAYDAQTKQWFQWGSKQALSNNPGVWICQTAAGQGKFNYAGSSIDGRVWLIDELNHTDDGLPIQVIIGGARWITEGVERANNLAIQMVRGVATTAIPDPQIQMRWSEDGGRTWTSWLQASIGAVGAYRWKASWHSLGLIRQPGREFEFAISDSVNVTLESATINPARR